MIKQEVSYCGLQCTTYNRGHRDDYRRSASGGARAGTLGRTRAVDGHEDPEVFISTGFGTLDMTEM